MISEMGQIEISVNGQRERIRAGLTIEQLAERRGLLQKDGVAIAVNECVIKRGDWGQYQLSSGDRIVLITAAQGG